MYRIRSADDDKLPLLIHPDIIREYEDNHVDTLHKKVYEKPCDENDTNDVDNTMDET